MKYFNQACIKMGGYSRVELELWKPYQFLETVVHPDDRQMVADQLRKKQSGDTAGIIPHYQFRFIKKSGEVIWVEIFSRTGHYNGALADILILIEVTDKHELEQKLRDSEAVFRTISEQSSLGIIIVQQDRIAYANKKLADIMDIPIERLVGFSVNDVMAQIGDKSLETIIADLKERIPRKSDHEEAFTLQVASRSGKVKTLQMYSKQVTISQQPADLITVLDVTAKADLESVLAEEEKKFRIIAEQSSLGIAIIQDGNIVYINEICAGMLEKKPADMVGLPFEPLLNLIQDDDREARLEKYKLWLAGMHIQENRYALTMALPSGKRITLEVFSKSIDYNGKKAILVTALDVTARSTAEQELKESEEKFHFIAEKSLIGIIFLQAGKVRYVNDHAASIYGYKAAEMLAWNEQHLFMKVHPGDRVPTSTSFLDHLHTNEVQEAAYRIITRDGKVKWIQTTSGALSYRGEEATLLVISDVTDAKESEIRLKESEEKYRQVYEESAAAIVLLSIKGVLIDCNSATEELFKLEKSKIVGRPLRDFFPIMEIDPSHIKDTLKSVVQNQRVEPFELEISTKPGPNIWVRAQAARIKYGSTNMLQIIINDITVKKNLEKVLEEENVKLKHLDTIRKNFIFTATHELKTPLMSLYGASEFLLQVLPGGIDDKIRTMIDIIHRGAERLKALVDNLLDVSRMDTGNFKLNRQDIDLSDLVRQTLANLGYLVNTAGDEIVLKLEDHLITYADRIRMEQVITNLLSNAIKNTPKGGRIELSLVRNGDTAKFSIKDSGVGLTADEMGELFKQFGKLERTDLNVPVNIQGSGLGLYITRNIIEMHGGSIWAESGGRNKGATFSFTIPISASK
jgi:PAS domain S-box-containing protein